MQWNAEIEVYDERYPDYKMTLHVENIDDCCDEHSYSTANFIGKTLADALKKTWKQPFVYRIVSVPQVA